MPRAATPGIERSILCRRSDLMTNVRPSKCPLCGAPKSRGGTTCMECRDRMHYTQDANIVPRPCRKCSRVLSGDEFRLRKVSDRKLGGFRRESICLDCYRADARQRARVRAEAGKPWTDQAAQLRHYARKNWHVDPNQIVGYVESHSGLCEICGRTAEEATNCGKRLAVDHSDAGVRGMLCHHCNAGLGHFRDDPALFLRAIAYLAQEPALPRVDQPELINKKHGPVR